MTGLLRRVSLSAAVSVGVLATLAVASVGAAGGFGQAPGHYVMHDTSAVSSFFNPVDGSNASVSVDRSLFTFRPKGGRGETTQNMTVLSVFIFTPAPDPTQPPLVSASGCFVIPDSAFVVSNNLQTSTLSATVNAGDTCPALLSPALGAVPAAGKGGGGGGGGFAFPLTVTGLWTGTGLVGTQTDQGRFTCGGFSAATHSNLRSALSSATEFSVSGFGTFSGGPNAFGEVTVSDTTLEVGGTGVLPAGCVGGGKGD